MQKLEIEAISRSKTNIYKQSANVFLHCMKKIKYLKEILENRAIIPRYNVENIGFLNIDGEEEIAFPMICFCDIFLGKLKSHMSVYGEYGIGLDKNFGIYNGFEPINYVNTDSKLINNLRNTMRYLYNNYDGNVDDIYIEQLMHNLLYIKPIYGKMKIFDNTYRNVLFADEREWRYIPDMNDTDMDLLLSFKNLTMENLQLYSKALRCNEKQWLKLDINAIKYIIVKEKNVCSMIRFIKKLDKWDDNEKNILISRIVKFDELERDM